MSKLEEMTKDQLISELEETRLQYQSMKEGIVMWQKASMRLNERLDSAEEALKLYADFHNENYSLPSRDTARAHFAQWEEKEK